MKIGVGNCPTGCGTNSGSLRMFLLKKEWPDYEQILSLCVQDMKFRLSGLQF